MTTPKELFGSKRDFMAACYLAAMRGHISCWSIPGSELDRHGWGGVMGFLGLPAPWEQLKVEVDERGFDDVSAEYLSWRQRYEKARVEAIGKGQNLTSQEFVAVEAAEGKSVATLNVA